MADTLSRIFGPALLSNAAATKYTVPAATTAVIRQIQVANTSGSDATLTVSIGADAAGTRLFSAVNVPANSVLSWTGNMVMAATEILQAYSGTNNVLAMTVNAVLVT